MYKPVILVILDGFGRGQENVANAIFKAQKPNFDFIEKNAYGLHAETEDHRGNSHRQSCSKAIDKRQKNSCGPAQGKRNESPEK